MPDPDTPSPKPSEDAGISIPPKPATGTPAPPSSRPTASHYAPELPLPEELQAMLGDAYVVEDFLGQGGMGAVYKGLQMPLRRPVAIKILRKGAGMEYGFEERFRREAYAMAALTHPHIVQVYDCGDAGEHHLFISMELVEGGDLAALMKRGEMTVERALKIIPQICDALEFAHQHGIIHRDIKPANIFLTKDGRAKVADFGLAKTLDAASIMTKTGQGMGTPDYAAPEQYDGSKGIDHRADIYSLGVMMYHTITGSLPRGYIKMPSVACGCDPRLDHIIVKAMQTEREQRYQSAGAMKADLAPILAAPSPTNMRASGAATAARPATAPVKPTPAPPAPSRAASAASPASAPAPTSTTTPPPSEAPAKKSKAGVIIGIVAMVALIAGGSVLFLKNRGGGSAGTSTSIPGLPDLPPLKLQMGPGFVKEFTVPGGFIHNVELLSDNRRMLVRSGGLALFDMETEKKVWTIQKGSLTNAGALQASDHGGRFATCIPMDAAGKATGDPAKFATFVVTLHDTATGAELQQWTVPGGPTHYGYDHMAISPSGRRIVVRISGKTGMKNGEFVGLEQGAPEPVVRWKLPEMNGYSTLSIDEDRFLVSGGGMGARILSFSRPTEMDSFAQPAPYHSASVSPDGREVVAESVIWDIASRKRLRSLERATRGMDHVQFCGTDRVIAKGDGAANSEVFIWQSSTGKYLSSFRLNRDDRIATAIWGSKDGRFFVAKVRPRDAPTTGNLFQIWRMP